MSNSPTEVMTEAVALLREAGEVIGWHPCILCDGDGAHMTTDCLGARIDKFLRSADNPPINTDYQTHEERHDVSAGDVPMAEWGPDGTYCRTCGGVSPDWYDPGYHGLPEVAGQYHRGHKDGCPRNTDYREQTHG